MNARYYVFDGESYGGCIGVHPKPDGKWPAEDEVVRLVREQMCLPETEDLSVRQVNEEEALTRIHANASSPERDGCPVCYESRVTAAREMMAEALIPPRLSATDYDLCHLHKREGVNTKSSFLVLPNADDTAPAKVEKIPDAALVLFDGHSRRAEEALAVMQKGEIEAIGHMAVAAAMMLQSTLNADKREVARMMDGYLHLTALRDSRPDDLVEMHAKDGKAAGVVTLN